MNKIRRPEIRFNQFSNDWQEESYSDTFSDLSNNTLSRADLNYQSGLAKNVHYGDILIKFREILDLEKDEVPFISENNLIDKYKASKLQNGDVIFADAAEDDTVGKCIELTNIGNESIYPGLHTIAARPIFPFASFYLGYYLNSPAYHNQLVNLMQGTKVMSISKSAIKQTSILFPKDKTEQKKIGAFFQTIDQLITLHQQKYDKLVILKKAMLVKMFPRDGEAVPEIRFKGFDGEWEEKKLGDLGEVAMNKRIFKHETSEKGEIPFYKIGSFGGEADAYITRELFDEYKSKYQYPNSGDILISASGSIGRVVEYLGKDEYFQDSNIVWLDHGGNVCNKFLKHFYTIIEWDGLEGSTIKRLYNKSILSTAIVLPSKEEQIIIGEYFETVDKQINLHQTQLDKLNNIKKACFSKMFVAQD